MPGTAGGTNTTETSVGVNGATSAANDGVVGNNTTAVAVSIIDAVIDNLGTVASASGGTTASVLDNDQVGAISASTATPVNVVLTANGAQVFTGSGAASVLVLNPNGTITVPASATPGSYAVPYQICVTPAATPPACDTATATVVVSGTPSLQVMKTAGVPTVAAGIDPNRTDAGDSVAYAFAVMNTGNVDLTNVTISDPKLPSLTCIPVATLAVGATVSISCSSGNVYTLTAADVAAGSTTNVATGTGVAPPNTCAIAPCTVTGTGTATVPSTPNSGITVTKLANPGVLPAAGSVINYIILVENTGKTALTNVNVTDPVAGAVTCPGGNPIPTLAVNGSVTCTASYTVTAADVIAGSKTNVASATGTAPPNTCAAPPCTVTGSGTITVSVPSSAPEIKVVKKASPTTAATIGQVIDYTIVGSNTGNVTLTNVSISDTKIPTLTCVPAAPATLTVGQTITCTGSYTLTAVDASSGSVTNIATGTGTPPNGPPVTGTGTATTPIVPIAIDDSDSTSLNQPVTTPVSPNDSYPPGSTVTTGGTSTNGGTVSCTLATPASCTYTPPLGFVGTDTYTYQLCLPAPNGTVCDNAIVTVTVNAGVADLAVQKNGPAAVQAGSLITYTLTLINNGLSAANGATFSDTLPAGLTGVSATCTGTSGSGTSACAAIPLTVTGTSISGSIPQFPSGGSVLISVRATAPANGPLVNTVTITPPPGVNDPVPSNNTSTVTTNVGTPPLEADISVVKAGPSAVSVLGAISYVIDVVNAGPGAANGSVFTDTVPAAITGVSWTCTASGQAVCPSANGAGNSINQTLAIMPMNGRLRYVVTGTAPAAATTLANTATVATPPGVTDPNPSNNTSTVSTVVSTTSLTVANLSMSKIGPATVTPFGVVRYTLVATNNGPASADGATVTDTFPNVLSGVTWTCTASAGASCGAASGSGNLNLALPTFASGSQVTVIVTGTAPASGTFQNSARVIAPPTVIDPDPSDNIGGPVVTAILLGPADLTTTVSITPMGNIVQGQPVVATVVMSNIGPSPAGNVVVTLQLPPGATSVVPGSGGVYNPLTQTVTWPLISFVPANTTPVVTYTVSFVPPPTGGTIRSDVTTPDSEVTLTNNPASLVISIQAPQPPPAPIPTVPWWLIALLLAGLAGRSLRGQTAPNKL